VTDSDTELITVVKSSIVQAPGVNVLKLLFVVIDSRTNKLECFALKSFKYSLLFVSKARSLCIEWGAVR
jgi:hypothetical protein